jgi:hypothetical protein
MFYGETCSKLNNVLRGNMEKNAVLDPWFVTGFSDGEAAFTYSKCNNVFALYFSVRQREDNREIVEKIQGYFGGIGKIYRGKEALPTKNSGYTKPSAYYRVCKQEELMNIVAHFDKYPLQSKKQEVYNVWRQMAITKTHYALNCESEEFKIFSEKLSRMNQKSRAFKKHLK